MDENTTSNQPLFDEIIGQETVDIVAQATGASCTSSASEAHAQKNHRVRNTVIAGSATLAVLSQLISSRIPSLSRSLARRTRAFGI